MITPRFLAIVAPETAGRAQSILTAAAGMAGFDKAHAGPRLTLFTGTGTPLRAIDDQAVLVGSVHPGCGNHDGELGPRALQDGGRGLVAGWWGDYVCLSEHPADAAVSVIRAPSGGVHAFRVRTDDVVLIASHIELLIDVGAVRPAVDWDFAAQHLAFTHLCGSATGILGIDEIVAGDCVTEQNGSTKHAMPWSPWEFARASKRAATLDEAAERVGDAILTSMAALTAAENHLLLELSGGLDSSIVAAAAMQFGRRVSAVNLVTPGPEGDERYYARLVAEHCKIPLEEARIDADIDLTTPVAQLTARPGLPAMLAPVDRLFEIFARAHGATAFISGTGGDSVFCSLGSATPAIDLFKAKGASLGVITTLRDIAAVHDTNAWRVAAIMGRQLRRGATRLRWKRNTRFLDQARVPDAPSPHPWLDNELAHALPGTRAHIRAIMAAYAHLDDFGRHQAAPSLYPLLAQPVVEACLSIPSWLWVAGGRNRSAARAAFAGLLPAAVAERRTKGAMDAYCARTFEANRTRLKPFLLDGCLADAGLLDRRAIEDYLSQPLGARDALFYHLLPIVDTEAWARRVTSGS